MTAERGGHRFRISLRTLLVLPVLVALITSFPDAVQAILNVLKTVAPAIPTLAVCAFFFRVSPHPRTALITTALGACVGLFFSPTFFVNLQSLLLIILMDGMKARWVSPTLMYDAAPPATAAFIFGTVGFIIAQLPLKRVEEGDVAQSGKPRSKVLDRGVSD